MKATLRKLERLRQRREREERQYAPIVLIDEPDAERRQQLIARAMARPGTDSRLISVIEVVIPEG